MLAVGLIMRFADLPQELMAGATNDGGASLALRGGSCIVAPDGSFVTQPVFDCETIITAELDPAMSDRERLTLDVSGHYQRADIFDLAVKRTRR